jgi:hypothetical protein
VETVADVQPHPWERESNAKCFELNFPQQAAETAAGGMGCNFVLSLPECARLRESKTKFW